MVHSYGLDLPDALYEGIEDAREKGQHKNDWIYGAVRMRLELTEAAEAAGMGDELDDDWWRDWLYDAAREELRERRERELADEGEREEIEAD